MEQKPEDFDAVQKLLALKRHEQPPPRFFNEFSDSVLSRLDAPVPERPGRWWQRLGLDFDLQPPLVCALGVVVCGLLVIGFITALDHKEPSPFMAQPAADNALVLTPPGSAAVTPRTLNTVAKPDEKSGSTAPVVSSASSPFNQSALRAQPVGAAATGGN